MRFTTKSGFAVLVLCWWHVTVSCYEERIACKTTDNAAPYCAPNVIALHEVSTGHLPSAHCTRNISSETVVGESLFRYYLTGASGHQQGRPIPGNIGSYVVTEYECISVSTISHMCSSSSNNKTGRHLSVMNEQYPNSGTNSSYTDCNCSLSSTSSNVTIHTYDTKMTRNQMLSLKYTNGTVIKEWSYCDPKKRFKQTETMVVSTNTPMAFIWHDGETSTPAMFWVGIEANSTGRIKMDCSKNVTLLPSSISTVTTTSTSSLKPVSAVTGTSISGSTSPNQTLVATSRYASSESISSLASGVTFSSSISTNHSSTLSGSLTTTKLLTAILSTSSTARGPVSASSTTGSSSADNRTEPSTLSDSLTTTELSISTNHSSTLLGSLTKTELLTTILSTSSTARSPVSVSSTTGSSSADNRTEPESKGGSLIWIIIVCILLLLILITCIVCLVKRKKKLQKIQPENGQLAQNGKDDSKQGSDDELPHEAEEARHGNEPVQRNKLSSLPKIPFGPPARVRYNNSATDGVSNSTPRLPDDIPVPPIPSFLIANGINNTHTNALRDGDEALFENAEPDDPERARERKRERKKKKKKKKKRKHRHEDDDGIELNYDVDDTFNENLNKLLV